MQAPFSSPIANFTDTRVDVSSWTIKNPDGHTPHLTFDILKRRRGEREHSALIYARSKLRCWDRRLDHAVPDRDVVAHQLLLPPQAPDLLASPHALWSTVDAATNWDGEPHLLAGPTIWFPDLQRQHFALRQVLAFAQTELVDKHGVAAHVIAHSPALIAHGADFHVHVLCTARRVMGTGFSTFAQELLHDGCQTRTKEAWDAWWSANSMP